MSRYSYLKDIYIGGISQAKDLNWLYSKDISIIINTTIEIDNLYPNLFDYYNLDLRDDKKTIIIPFLDTISNTITSQLNRKKRILIHSKRGMSRCVAILAYYIMNISKCSLKRSLYLIKRRYGPHDMNISFWHQLNSLSLVSNSI